MKITISRINLKRLLSACDSKNNNRFYRQLHIKKDGKDINYYTTNCALIAKYTIKEIDEQAENVTLVFPEKIKILKTKLYEIGKDNDNYYLQIYHYPESRQHLQKWQGVAPDFERLIKDQTEGATLANDYICYHPVNYAIAYEILGNAILACPLTRGSKYASIWNSIDKNWQVLLMPVKIS